MSGAPGPKARAIRDAIAATLRDADVPLATRQVEARTRHRHWDVYPNLRAMERAGLVERADVPRHVRDVFWRLTPAPVDVPFNREFEELAAQLDTSGGGAL